MPATKRRRLDGESERMKKEEEEQICLLTWRERDRGRGVKGSVAEFALVSTFHLSSPLENDVPLVENNPNTAPDQNGGSNII